MKYPNSNGPFTFGIVIILFFQIACGEKDIPTTLFTKVNVQESGLDFNNQLTENDSINIIDNEFVYNGAGVALGDLDGDGLDDIFLAGNQVENKLFLNKGELQFEDVSQKAGIIKPDSLLWSSGVSIVDINLDGYKDIYICNTFYRDSLRRKNLLYINQGIDGSGIPQFEEMGMAYGVADETYSSHSQFFDYDNDGDLDLFIGVNRIEGIDPSEFRPLEDDGTSMSKDKLYENQWNDSLQHPVFVDVSQKAGIRFHGYSHSTLINDFNEDGWLDIYVANDFLSNDLMYINNQDGTFTNRAGEAFQHFSLSSMGSDIADIDNDGRLDIYITEMQPYYNKRKKLFQGPSSYQKEIFTKRYGYESQYARNTMQLNLGINPETGVPIFGDMGLYAGVQETDWSWAPLFADFNNDSWQDLFITNGFPKDVTDRDFGDFRVTASRLVSKETLIAAIPEIKIPNFAFKNLGNLGFTDATQEWGLNFGTYSSGAAYGDLDRDGDLDLVINNINEPALLLQNNSNLMSAHNRYLRIALVGKDENPAAIGAVVALYTDGAVQKKSVLSGRGYLSQPEQVLHFGLGSSTMADSIIVQWPGEGRQKLTQIAADSMLRITYQVSESEKHFSSQNLEKPLFKEVSEAYNLDHFSVDHDFIDFNFQRTLPHKFSQYGPSLAIGDVNNDGLDDMFVAASRKFKQKWFIQEMDGSFRQREVAYKKDAELLEEDAGTLLFDADDDGDLDLYIARGCGQYPPGHEFYKDLLLINDGNGNFVEAPDALPDLMANSSSVKAADYDRDGDLDLFVGSRVLPFSYPLADRSYILRNESTSDGPKFIDVTQDVFPETHPGLISDALWTDFDGDFWPDLILAGEWMPLRFFRNQNGKLIEVTKDTGIGENQGWWNSLAAADLDNDGDMDYIAGNSGQNIYFKGNAEEPVRVYAKDLDQNGTVDPLISYYLRDSMGTKKEYLYHPWQDVTKQFVGIRKKFNSFGEFGESTFPEMFADGSMNDATVLSFNYMQSSWVENLGNGKFEIHPLPTTAQLAPIYGIMPMHLDDDAYLDLLLVGNDYGMEVQQGPADALVGLALRNRGKEKGFVPITLEKSHFLVPGDGKSLVTLQGNDEKILVIASQNNDSLRVFEPSSQPFKRLIKLATNEVKSQTFLEDGSQNTQEFFWGDTFQSQSTRTLMVPANATEVRILDYTGKETRKIVF